MLTFNFLIELFWMDKAVSRDLKSLHSINGNFSHVIQYLIFGWLDLINQIIQ